MRDLDILEQGCIAPLHLVEVTNEIRCSVSKTVRSVTYRPFVNGSPLIPVTTVDCSGGKRLRSPYPGVAR